MTKCKPVFDGLILQFLIFFCLGAFAMIHLSCHTIPLRFVSQPRYIWAIDAKPLFIYKTVLKKCHLSPGTGYPNFACLPGLWPILLHKSLARVIHPSMYAQDFFSTNWSTPYQLSTFQLIRFMLIEALTWHIIIKPSQMFFVLTHHKRPTLSRTDATLDKRSRAIILFFPLFYIFFMLKKTFKLPSGTDYYLVNPWVCFTSMSGLLWCLVTWVPWLSLLVSSMCLCQVCLGHLRDWVPICWLVTEGSCVTDFHLLR
jgi:hypothetical protein